MVSVAAGPTHRFQHLIQTRLVGGGGPGEVELLQRGERHVISECRAEMPARAAQTQHAQLVRVPQQSAGRTTRTREHTSSMTRTREHTSSMTRTREHTSSTTRTREHTSSTTRTREHTSTNLADNLPKQS